MPEFEQGYVPLEYAQSTRARFVVHLPEFVNTDQIGVNLRGLDRLCRIGGIGHVRVTSSEGETTQFVPTVVGISKNGEAIASKTGVRTSIPTFTVDSEKERPGLDSFPSALPHAASWINTTININTNEVANRIQDDSKWKHGVHSTEAWAYHLNQAVRQGVTDSALKHLTMGLSKINWGETAFQYGLMGFFESQNGNPTLESGIFRYFFVGGFLNMLAYVRSRGYGEDFRISAFYGPQLDRALILKLMSARTTLVKDFSSTPNGKVDTKLLLGV